MARMGTIAVQIVRAITRAIDGEIIIPASKPITGIRPKKKMLIGNRRKCKENRNTGISGQRNTDRKKLKAPKKQKMMTIRKELQKK